VFPKSPGDSDFWTIARTKVSPIQGKHSFTEHQNDIIMETYSVLEIQNNEMLNGEGEAIDVRYLNPGGQVEGLGFLACGESINQSLEIPDSGEILTVYLDGMEKKFAVQLRQTEAADGTAVIQALVNEGQWASANYHHLGGRWTVKVSFPNSSEGILVIGTVDIGDE
jgi:hypothetical protein